MAIAGVMDTPEPTAIFALLTRIDAKLGDGPAQFQRDVAAQFDAIARRFDAMDARFDAMDARFDGIDKRLDAMDARFDGIDKRLDAMDARFDRLDRRLDAMDRRIDRKIDGLRVELVDHMERLHLELALRVQDLEGRPPRGSGGGQALAG
jgi:hypothetical protein